MLHAKRKKSWHKKHICDAKECERMRIVKESTAQTRIHNITTSSDTFWQHLESNRRTNEWQEYRWCKIVILEKINSVIKLNGDRSATMTAALHVLGRWDGCCTWDALHVQSHKLLALLLQFLFLPLRAVTTALGDDFGNVFEKVVQKKLSRIFGVDGIQKQLKFMNVFVGNSQRSLAGPGVTVTGKNREHVYKCHFYLMWCAWKKSNSETCLKIFCLKTINVKMETWCDDGCVEVDRKTQFDAWQAIFYLSLFFERNECSWWQ